MCETIEPTNSTDVDWRQRERQHYDKYKDLLVDYDIIHDHTWFGFAYLSKKEKPCINVIHTHHGHLNWQTKPCALPNLVAISKWMKSQYALQNWVSRHVYNGIDLDDYPLKKNADRDRLVFIGRLDSFKQPHIAVEVARKTQMKLDIIGGSFVNDKQYMQNIIDSCDGKQIRLLKDADHKQKLESLQHAMAIIVPSKMGEPFGLTPVEAMATGTPVIASADGAIPETVSVPSVGRICADADSMAKVVNQIRDGSLQFDPGACRKHVEKNFTKEIMATNYEELYRQIIFDGRQW